MARDFFLNNTHAFIDVNSVSKSISMHFMQHVQAEGQYMECGPQLNCISCYYVQHQSHHTNKKTQIYCSRNYTIALFATVLLLHSMLRKGSYNVKVNPPTNVNSNTTSIRSHFPQIIDKSSPQWLQKNIIYIKSTNSLQKAVSNTICSVRVDASLVHRFKR